MDYLVIRRLLTAAAVGSLMVSGIPVQAQFGGLFGKKQEERPADGCAKDSSKQQKRAILGALVGQVMGNATSRVSGLSWVPVSTFADTLTVAIACRLDPDEQKQAAEATLQATRSGEDQSEPEVGASAEWTSATRENVTGSSTVTERSRADDGRQCISVTDVIIVNGEETTANKRMCRKPPAVRYALA